ncbi:MAG: efflux RND transporter periplasmic adaptor subunit [Verrucomicrobiae bacterium]|nr:efflux RND transporter periplasmic adaptor subunit [Verrucomicrobiae bacterium]
MHQASDEGGKAGAGREGWIRRIVGRVGLAMGLAVGLLGSGAGCRERPPSGGVPPPVVRVMTLTTTNVPTEHEFIGQLESIANVEIRARVEAFVERIAFEEGGDVEAGALLFELDPRPFEQQLLVAEGALSEARAALGKSEKDVARLRPLAERKAIPMQDLDNALAAVEVARSQVASAEARVEGARISLGYCEVRSPVAGRIGASEVSRGTLVGRGQPTLLATVSPLDPIWVHCNVSEVALLASERALREHGRDRGEVVLGLVLADGTTYSETGRFVFLDRAVDPTTGTIRVRAEFPNPDRLLRPGMFARLVFRPGMRTGVVVVPQRAVQELQGQTLVWVVNAEGKAQQRPVRMGRRVGSDWLVEEGLQAGERLVVEGLQKVRQDAPVQAETGGPGTGG